MFQPSLPQHLCPGGTGILPAVTLLFSQEPGATSSRGKEEAFSAPLPAPLLITSYSADLYQTFTMCQTLLGTKEMTISKRNMVPAFICQKTDINDCILITTNYCPEHLCANHLLFWDRPRYLHHPAEVSVSAYSPRVIQNLESRPYQFSNLNTSPGEKTGLT